MLGRLRFVEIQSGVQPCEPKPCPAEARKTRPADFGTRIFLVPLLKPRTGCGSRNTANYKNAERQKPAQKTARQNKQFLIPTAPLRRQRTAESTNHADKSRSPCHSGCEVAGSEDKTKIIHTEKFGRATGEETEPKGWAAQNRSKRLRNGCPENDIKQNS